MARVAGDVGNLESLVRDERVRLLLQPLKPLVDSKLALSREIIDLRRRGGFEAAAELIGTNRGKETMDGIRRLLSEMRDRERELLPHRSEAAESEARMADVVFFLGSLISGLMVVAIFWFLRLEVLARERTESDLRRHNAIFDGILTSMVDGVIVADPQGAILLMNPTAERLLGRNFQHAGAGFAGERAIVFRPDGQTPYPPEDVPLARALRGQSLDGVECIVRLPERKTPVWFSLSARPLSGGDGQRIGR